MGQRVEELLAQARRAAPLAGRRGEDSLLLAKAQGCRVFDADNVAYLDLLGGARLQPPRLRQPVPARRGAARLDDWAWQAGFHAAAELELVELLRGAAARRSRRG